jgi:hypothetical protein
MTNRTPLGVIEGFFGRSWRWSQRAELAGFLRDQGYQYYIYAPKSDQCLRSSWQKDWEPSQWQALSRLRSVYRQAGIQFGIGLSPLDLCTSPKGAQHTDLVTKIKRINQLQPDLLALLFDDMRGDLPHLASTQVELAHRAAAHSNASQVILCPTYYSDDPVLERVFGTRPNHYWRTLGQTLDSSIELFWTGPEVCSKRFTRAHLKSVAERLGRQPFLWDNYPVNDGAVKSQLLHLAPFGPDRANIGDLLAGHAVNPMNQFNLSKLAIASLPHAYQSSPYKPQALFKQLLEQLCPGPVSRALHEDAHHFAHQGLAHYDAATTARLLKKYQALEDSSGMAREVIDWLEGSYAFDPNCLTE